MRYRNVVCVMDYALFKQFKEHAETALAHGHDMTFEWPRYSDSWKRKVDVMSFFEDSRFMSVDFDGSRFGVCDDQAVGRSRSFGAK